MFQTQNTYGLNFVLVVSMVTNTCGTFKSFIYYFDFGLNQLNYDMLYIIKVKYFCVSWKVHRKLSQQNGIYCFENKPVHMVSRNCAQAIHIDNLSEILSCVIIILHFRFLMVTIIYQAEIRLHLIKFDLLPQLFVFVSFQQ